MLASVPNAADFAFFDGQTFIGSRLAADKRSFSATGEMHGMAILQDYHLDTDQLRNADGSPVPQMKSGLLGGFLPAARWSWVLAQADTHAEQIAFALPESTARRPFDSDSPQPVWIRYLNVSASTGELRYVHYVDTYEAYPGQVEAGMCSRHRVWKTAAGGSYPTNLQCSGEGAALFYADLLSFALYWNRTFEAEGAMELDLPVHGIDVASFARSSLVREMITRRGDYHPRYGAPPLYYGTAACCDGFQDTFVAAAAAYLEHGLFETARGVVDNYFTFYVRRGAIINVRGPELAQYGRMLTVVAQYHSYTGDGALLLKHEHKLRDIQAMLMRRRAAALRLPAADPSHGLLRGIDEADELFKWTKASSELPHLSMSLEAWRGFRDLARVWLQLARTHARPDLAIMAEELGRNASALKADADRAVAVSAFRDTTDGAVCNPYVAGEKTCGYMGDPGADAGPGPFLHPNDRASEPFRSYAGMLFSGGLSHETTRQIVQYNQDHAFLSRIGIWGGGCVSTVQMAFTEQGHGYGLVQHDFAEAFLLQLYSEMAHVCTRGTWTCFESRTLTADRASVTPAGGYASPAQMVVPLHLKWALVFEDPVTGVLWLCKTIPRSWLNTGERVAVRRAPTSRGRVSLTLRSELGTAGRIMANVTLPARAASRAPNNATGSMAMLRLRAPTAWVMSSVMVDGRMWREFNSSAETVSVASWVG